MELKEAFSLRPFGNVWILLVLVLAAVVLGVLNNFRVYEERRVAWFGGAATDTVKEGGDESAQ